MLIRVGIDSTYGEWNAPVNPVNRDFVFIPIPENKKHELKENQTFPYNYFISDLKKFSLNNSLYDKNEISLPKYLHGLNTHLDPDFNYLTYGDNGVRRGNKLINQFQKDDFIVFYAGLKPITKFLYPLYYAIIGFYKIEKILEARDIQTCDSIINAHTRKKIPNPTDVIIQANPSCSGRLEKCVLIGEFRNRAYRVSSELLREWEGISANDGYLQRSASPPIFKNPDNFLQWFAKQNVKLLRKNN